MTDLERVKVGAGASDRRASEGLSSVMRGLGAPRASLEPSDPYRWFMAKPPRVGHLLGVRIHAAACAGGARMCGARTSVARIAIDAPQSGQT